MKPKLNVFAKKVYGKMEENNLQNKMMMKILGCLVVGSLLMAMLPCTEQILDTKGVMVG